MSFCFLCWTLLVGNLAATKSVETLYDRQEKPGCDSEDVSNYLASEEFAIQDPLNVPVKVEDSNPDNERGPLGKRSATRPQQPPQKQSEKASYIQQGAMSSIKSKKKVEINSSGLMSKTAAKMLSPNFRTDNSTFADNYPFKNRFIDLIETLKNEDTSQSVEEESTERKVPLNEMNKYSKQLDSAGKQKKEGMIAKNLYDNYLLGVSSFLMQGLPLPDVMTVPPPANISPSVDLTVAHLVAPYMTIAPRGKDEPKASEPPTPEPINWSELHQPDEPKLTLEVTEPPKKGVEATERSEPSAKAIVKDQQQLKKQTAQPASPSETPLKGDVKDQAKKLTAQTASRSDTPAPKVDKEKQQRKQVNLSTDNSTQKPSKKSRKNADAKKYRLQGRGGPSYSNTRKGSSLSRPQKSL